MTDNMEVTDTEQTATSPTPRQAADQAAQAEAAATVEAILFATDSPISVAKVSSVAELPVREVKKAIAMLNERYEAGGAAYRIEAIAGGYQMMTSPEYHDVLSRLLRTRRESRLSQAALETLAIVAYRQPIIRADIEAIRGVACGEMLRNLLEKALVKIAGRADVLGRPMLYGTTTRFLETFGLASLDDLPRVEELRSGASQAARPDASAEIGQVKQAPSPDEPGRPEMPAGADSGPVEDPHEAGSSDASGTQPIQE